MTEAIWFSLRQWFRDRCAGENHYFLASSNEIDAFTQELYPTAQRPSASIHFVVVVHSKALSILAADGYASLVDLRYTKRLIVSNNNNDFANNDRHITRVESVVACTKTHIVLFGSPDNTLLLSFERMRLPL